MYRIRDLRGRRMGPRRNDQQQKGYATTAQAAEAKIREKWLNERVTRRELFEYLSKLEAFDKFVYDNSPEVKAALDKLTAANQQGQRVESETISETIPETGGEVVYQGDEQCQTLS